MCCNRVLAASGNVSIPPRRDMPLGGVERTRLSRYGVAAVVGGPFLACRMPWRTTGVSLVRNSPSR